MTKKLYIKTNGCQMNEYDSSSIANVLKKSHGLELTKNPEEADVILFNTCSVREKANEKVFSQLGAVRHVKTARPQVIIGVGGCVASQEGAAIRQRAAAKIDVARRLERADVVQRAGRSDGDVAAAMPGVEFNHRFLHA